ncbi:MAG: NAD(P)-binding protein, partial [Dermatophilaceae bacterium]
MMVGGDVSPGSGRNGPRAVVLGASIAGAAAAIQLARRGWEVAVVEPDLDRFGHAAQVPSVRPGAPHAVQAHVWMARATTELRDRLPDVYDGLLAEGVHESTFADRHPAPLVGGGRPGDEALTMLVMRRLVLDRVLWRVVSGEPRVNMRPARAVGLVTSRMRPPRVLGVRLATGAMLEADVVLDCTGRRTKVTSWLASHGAVEEVVERDCGLSYYGRHYRVGPGHRPRPNLGCAQVNNYPRGPHLWILGDRDHATLAMAAHDQDPCLKLLRRADAFGAAAQANPNLAPWLEISAPTTGVFVMGSLRNRLRRMVSDGAPVVLGLHHLGDSLANSNPTRGRGAAMALASASVLVDLLTDHPEDPHAQAMGYDAWVSGPLSLYWRGG